MSNKEVIKTGDFHYDKKSALCLYTDSYMGNWEYVVNCAVEDAINEELNSINESLYCDDEDYHVEIHPDDKNAILIYFTKVLELDLIDKYTKILVDLISHYKENIAVFENFNINKITYYKFKLEFEEMLIK